MINPSSTIERLGKLDKHDRRHLGPGVACPCGVRFDAQTGFTGYIRSWLVRPWAKNAACIPEVSVRKLLGCKATYSRFQMDWRALRAFARLELRVHVRRPNAVEISSPYGKENTVSRKSRSSNPKDYDPETMPWWHGSTLTKKTKTI